MERIDDLQCGLKVIQDTELFCFGTDAVLLADFARVPKNAKVVDLGTGTGILPLLLYARQEEAAYFGLELQEALCSMACRSVEMNGLADKITMVRGDIKDAHRFFGNANDVVVANPPYEKEGDGAARGEESHRIARKEVRITFDELCESAARLLKTGGKFFCIHRPARLPELFGAMTRHGLEPKALRMAHPYIDAEPKYVLLCAAKGAGAELRVLPPLVMRHTDGTETEALQQIYRRERE